MGEVGSQLVELGAVDDRGLAREVGVLMNFGNSCADSPATAQDWLDRLASTEPHSHERASDLQVVAAIDITDVSSSPRPQRQARKFLQGLLFQELHGKVSQHLALDDCGDGRSGYGGICADGCACGAGYLRRPALVGKPSE